MRAVLGWLGGLQHPAGPDSPGHDTCYVPDDAADSASAQCEADWQTIKWESIEYLQYLGLQPWYAQPTEGQQATDGQGAIRDVGLEPVPIITLPCAPCHLT